MNTSIILYLPHRQTAYEKHIAQQAEEFAIPIDNKLPKNTTFYLSIQNNRLTLCKINEKAQVYVDFTSSRLKYRRIHFQNELIAKATGLLRAGGGYGPIWDATGGLGRDAFILAKGSLVVHIFERHPVPAMLLTDGLYRARLEGDFWLKQTINRIHFHFGQIQDNINLPKPDVILLDPMFPERKKSASVKKEMQFLQEAIGADEDSDNLLITARHLARERIVVKRPVHSGFLANTKPNHQYINKSIRFDIYLPL